MTTVNLGTMFAGDTLIVNFTVQQANRTPQDLTNCAVRWAVASADLLSVPVLTKTEGNGVTITSAALGQCQAKIDAGDLTTPGLYRHELEVELQNGDTYTVAVGNLTVAEAILPEPAA